MCATNSGFAAWRKNKGAYLMEQVALGNVMVDCGDERALQAFYAELLGWERCAKRSGYGVPV